MNFCAFLIFSLLNASLALSPPLYSPPSPLPCTLLLPLYLLLSPLAPLLSPPLPPQLEDGSGTAMLCMLPAKFHRMLWLKRGSFVVADVSAAEEVDKAGGRVRGSITAVLFDHHIKELVASNQWPEAFAEAVVKERAGASAAAPLEQSQQEPQKQGAERSSAGEEGQGLRSSRGGAEEGREESTQRTRGDGQEKEEGVGEEEEGDDEEDDGLPPLERNPNHRPMFVEEDGSDEDSEEE
ncbi:unnamed protein product [Closterium sp. NIES-64]|nr:unnamed protein product [Closterium sp. NIES-64]CAI5987889.1 unnamed protein product [Closterium sp. NIES-65]